jgi:hypothetical protein
MSKQTAVEWLKMQLEIRSGIKEITVDSKTFEELCEQAKEMDKEQHRVTAQDFYYGSHSFKNFEQYYNETYGNT